MNKNKTLNAQNILSLVGRSLISSIFIASGVDKIRNRKQTAQYMASKDLPMIPLLHVGAATVETLGGVALFLGYRPRTAASVLALFLVPTSLIFHDFWKLEGQDRAMQQINFMKNLAIMGGLTKVIAFGAGDLSVRPPLLKSKPSLKAVRDQGVSLVSAA